MSLLRGLLFRYTCLTMIAMMGTAANMATYTWLRDYVLDNNVMIGSLLVLHSLIRSDSTKTDLFCGLTSSFWTALVMNPVDVVRTRLYNQTSSGSGSSSRSVDVDASRPLVSKWH